MGKTTPKIPKGTRDLLPIEATRREYIFSSLRDIFKKYGYAPIETPAYELLETLTGKYGEEGDKLMFRLLPRGRKLTSALASVVDKPEEPFQSEEALRYDLTVPFARFVVQHQNDLVFPFKRYQIQPVWRADKPQKGRYREFFQCDIDVIGSSSLWNEVELIQILSEAFTKLKLGEVQIKLNNRKILLGLAEVLGEADRFQQLTIALDKLDKIGAQGVVTELEGNGFKAETLRKLTPLLTGEATLDEMKTFLAASEEGQKGIQELNQVIDGLTEAERSKVKFDMTLARGLNYYTGAIIEVVHPEFNSSIAGGGRYDDLTSVFGLRDMSGVGVSFGADRIYDLMVTKDLFPMDLLSGSRLLFLNFGEEEAAYIMKLLPKLRDAGIACELYPDTAKIKKQFKYADQKAIPFVAAVGTEEMKNNTISLKDLGTGNQTSVTIEAVIEKLS